MESQQIMEFLLAMREDVKASQAKTEADRKADKEDIKTNQAELLAKLSADRQAHRRELKEMMEKIMNNSHVETTACQEMEAHPEEKEPTLVDMKPEEAER
jgi:hypothetical protein